MTAAMATKRKLVLKMSVSLDGFVAGPNGAFDWVFRSSSPDSRQSLLSTLSEADAHVMGSRSYYAMAAFWPYTAMPFATAMNDIPKIVFTRQSIQRERVNQAFAEARARQAEQPTVTPTEAVLQSWAEPTVASGDLVEEVLRLKDQPGSYILAHGGAQFAQSLIAASLVDEYRLAIHPVALGQGQPLFSALCSPADLRFIKATTFSCGVVGMVYQPA